MLKLSDTERHNNWVERKKEKRMLFVNDRNVIVCPGLGIHLKIAFISCEEKVFFHMRIVLQKFFAIGLLTLVIKLPQCRFLSFCNFYKTIYWY